MSKRITLNLAINCLIALVSSSTFAGAIADNKAIFANAFNTGISPGLELLIDQSLKNQKTKETLSLLDSEINKDPKNTTLLYKKASIYADQGEWKKTIDVLNQISSIQPDNEQANKLRQIVEEKKKLDPHNEVGFDIDEAYVSDLSSYWNYSSVHYYRLTDAGKFGGHVNYAHRYGTTGKQFQLEAYPLFSNNISGAFSVGYANTTQILYPNLQYMMEGYIDVAHGFEFSLGQSGNKYIRFGNQKIFNYTGTIGKYIGDSFVWFRPHYYTPKNTKFYELGWRHYFSDADNFISLIVAAGKLPDIGDLPPLDQMIIINQKGVGLNGQFSLTKSVFFKYGIGYIKQRFPTNLTREITDGNVGLIWRI